MCSNRIEQEEAARGKRRFLIFTMQVAVPFMFMLAGLFGMAAS